MKKFAFFLSLPVVLSAPALLAQESTAPDHAHAKAQVGTQTEAAPQGMDRSAATTAPANPASAVEVAVNSGFGQYDADGDGQLTEEEFKTWITALKTKELSTTGQPVNTAEVTAYANAAFASADADKDMKVSRAEVTGFLGG